MRHQLLRYHKEDGIDQCRIERIQKELCNTLAQILSQTTRHSQAIRYRNSQKQNTTIAKKATVICSQYLDNAVISFMSFQLSGKVTKNCANSKENNKKMLHQNDAASLNNKKVQVISIRRSVCSPDSSESRSQELA